MKIQKVNIPIHSKLYQTNYDYIDSYQGVFVSFKREMNSVEITKIFFNSISQWANNLFKIRNKVVSIFGLKTPEKTTKSMDDFTFEENEKKGLFRVYSKTENEIVLGEDDKHLNFRVSILKEPFENDKQKLTISTTVTFNNWFGKFYFLPVKPFHKLIVISMLKKTIKQLDENLLQNNFDN